MSKEKHEYGCDGTSVYTDGIFFICYCKAVVMNSIAGANFVHRDGKRKEERLTHD